MTQHRAYSVLEIRALDEDARIIEGMATTPTPDRLGDIVDPEGAQFALPLPLLWQHDSGSPVGHVEFAKVTKDGIPFRAKLAKIAEPGPLKEMIDKAWQAVKAQLVRGVSIGFSAKEYAFIEGTGGLRFTDWEWLELSLVTIPANREATIATIKSISAEQMAASGRSAATPPGASGKSKPVNLRPKEANEMKTIAEQIAALEAKRVASAARMEEVMQKSIDEGRSTDEAEQEEFDTLEQDLKAIDGDLRRLKALETAKAAKAAPIKATTERGGSDARAPASVKVTEQLEPGIRLARLARVKYWAMKNHMDVARVAEGMYPNDERLNAVCKAAVGAGSSDLGSTWGSQLVGEETAAFADFVEFLRPRTILGRFGTDGIPALRRVPFRVPLVTQTSGGAGYWVGEGAAKPLTSFAFTRTTLEPLKVANIAVVTDELLRYSSPSAEMVIRDQLAAALAQKLDSDFITPSVSAVAGISPASITNGITPVASAGDTADHIAVDIGALMQEFIDADNPLTSAVFIMSAGVAMQIALMKNALGQPEFPTMNWRGSGSLYGIPVIVSEHVPTVTAGGYVILANAQDIYLADEGGVQVDMSREASLQMDNAPTMTSDSPTGTSVVSMFQTNSVAFRAERTINWMRRRTEGVAVLSGVSWQTTAS